MIINIIKGNVFIKKLLLRKNIRRAFLVVLLLTSCVTMQAAGNQTVFNVSYSQVANLMKAISGVLIFVGAFKVFWMMEHGDRGVSKTIILIIGGCVALMAMITIIPKMFNI